MPSSGKRRWFQFRLRTILLLVIVASLALAPLGMRLDRIRRQQPAIVAVENAGGAVWIVRKPVNSPTPFPGLPTVYDSQRRDAGALWQVVEDAQYGEAVCVCFPSASPNSQLEVLELDHSQIRGGGLKHLAAMSQLKLLSLRHTPLTDEGLEQLAKLTELRRLYFYDTAVTDAGLARLRPLKKLEILHLGKTGVTFAGADEFEKDLPRSPIIR
jgi:hypothetical protein